MESAEVEIDVLNSTEDQTCVDDANKDSDEDEGVVGRRDDIKSLLNFMNLASDNIKASLDRSAACKRSVDHKKYLQKQLQHLTGSSQPLSGFGGGATCPILGSAASGRGKPEPYHRTTRPQVENAENDAAAPVQSDGLSGAKRVKLALLTPVDTATVHFGSKPEFSPEKTATMSNSNVQALEANTNKRDNDNREDDPESGEPEDKALTADLRVKANLMLMDSLFKESDTLVAHSNKSADQKDHGQKSVPLRQRSLPASFWKEPNHPQYPGDGRVLDGYSFLSSCPPPVSLERDRPLEHLCRLPSVNSTPYQMPLGAPPGLTELALKANLIAVDYPKFHLPAAYDEKVATHLGLCSDITRGLPFVSPPAPPFSDQAIPPAHLPQFHRHCVGLPARLSDQCLNPRLGPSGQPCPDCCLPKHPAAPGLPLLPPAAAQTAAMYGRIPAAVLSHRPSLWKPIPTKTISMFPSRYHPFAGVQ